MQYSRLGNTGLIVSRLAFGAMTFGTGAGPFASVSKVDEAHARAMIDASIDAGINFFDTANGYAAGQSEIMLGKLLGKRRKDVVVATKVGFALVPAMDAGLAIEHLFGVRRGAFERLGTDYIDLYIVHRDIASPGRETSTRSMPCSIRKGSIPGYSTGPPGKPQSHQIQKTGSYAITSGDALFAHRLTWARNHSFHARDRSRLTAPDSAAGALSAVNGTRETSRIPKTDSRFRHSALRRRWRSCL
jgi:hypothetical protein